MPTKVLEACVVQRNAKPYSQRTKAAISPKGRKKTYILKYVTIKKSLKVFYKVNFSKNKFWNANSDNSQFASCNRLNSDFVVAIMLNSLYTNSKEYL